MGRAKDAKGKGKKRQPGKPKRATSAYLYFLSHLRDQLKAQGKAIKIGDLAKEAAEKWHSMDSDTRWVLLPLHLQWDGNVRAILVSSAISLFFSRLTHVSPLFLLQKTL